MTKINNTCALTSHGATISKQEPGSFSVHGRLDFDTVSTLLDQGNHLIDQMPAPVVKLDTVNHVSSIGISLLLAWVRHARSQGKTLSFRGIPKRLVVLAELSGLGETLREWGSANG